MFSPVLIYVGIIPERGLVAKGSRTPTGTVGERRLSKNYVRSITFQNFGCEK
jgi:hypothetical protein